MKARSVVLNIAGERLSLKTDRDQAFLDELADFLNGQISGLKSAARNVPIQQIYLLVALKLADELCTERAAAGETRQEVLRRSNRLLRLIDTELEMMGNE